MKSNAPGQLLGYTIQFPRALYHLLRSGPGDAVCIEVLGDVATKMKNGDVKAEEDKSSLCSKPITDKSTDLWKTFFNWIDAIKAGSLDVEKTQYILYCNKAGRFSIVDQFSDAVTANDAREALKKAKEKLSDITSEHDIWEAFDYVVNQNENLLLKVICQFEVQYGNDAGYDEVDYEIRKKNVPSSQIDFLRDKISGWLLKTIQDKISKKEPAWVTWEEFDHEFSVVFERVRRRELVDFTLEFPPKEEDIHMQVKIRPRYLQQLDIIGCGDDEIVEAVSDYLRADVNRHKWIENELIDVDTATDFIAKLKGFWENQKKKIKITEKNLSDEEKGQLLLEECKCRQELIRDMSPPYPTIIGTYHSLAEEPVLGWHPTWQKLLIDKEEV
jgi:hypothetical protein